MKYEDPDRQKLIRLRKLLIEYFNLEDLRLLCFDLGLDYEELAGGAKSMKVQNLITYLERRGELQRLLDEAKNQRPNVDWPEFIRTTIVTEDNAADTKTDLEKNRRESVSGDQVGGDKIGTGDISDVRGAGIGEKAQGLSAGDVVGSIFQAQGDIKLGRDLRDEQYEIALNWDGQRRMRGYDLAGRDLSGLNLTNSDLRKANLQGADLSDTDLSGADLSGANLVGTDLSRTMCTKLTRWPDNFDPKSAGAILVNSKEDKAVNPYTMTRHILGNDYAPATQDPTADRLTAYERSRLLSDIHDKVKGGRQIMLNIFNIWANGRKIKVSQLSKEERENFKAFYNNEYHAKPWDTREKKMSGEIHTYLHELHFLWQSVNKQLTQEEIMEKMGEGIYMDRNLIPLYLEAHRDFHKEPDLWKGAEFIVGEAERWHAKRHA